MVRPLLTSLHSTAEWKAVGPGSWLLDMRVQARLDEFPLRVRFDVGYENGRWARRTATTLQSWFITEQLSKHEVALKWTDNRARVIHRNVHVQHLDSVRPEVEDWAMIIQGDGIGVIGYVVRRYPDNCVEIEMEESKIEFVVHERCLCRVADQDVLKPREYRDLVVDA